MLTATPTTALPRGGSFNRCYGGASIGLQPVLSHPPDSMILDDAALPTPSVTPRAPLHEELNIDDLDEWIQDVVEACVTPRVAVERITPRVDCEELDIPTEEQVWLDPD